MININSLISLFIFYNLLLSAIMVNQGGKTDIQDESLILKLKPYFTENKGVQNNSILFMSSINEQVLFKSNSLLIMENDHTYSELIFNSNRTSLVMGEDVINLTSNYYKPNCSINNIKCYDKLFYKGIWEGIDLKFYYDQIGIKYEIILNKYSDISKINLSYNNVNLYYSVSIDDNIIISDKIIIANYLASLLITFDKITNQEKTIHDYHINCIGFSTYYGGDNTDRPYIIKTDDQYIYVAGTTGSKNFPITTFSFNSNLSGDTDAFILIFDHHGNMVSSILIGGSGGEIAQDLFVSGSGKLYLIGNTGSTDFPITDISYLRENHDTMDIFIVKFDNYGRNLNRSSYYGGNGRDYGSSIILDNSDRIIFSGSSSANDLPITDNALYKNNSGEQDIFIAIMDMTYMALIYCSYFGGSSTEYCTSMALYDNNIIISGYTYSSDFLTTKNSFQQSFNGKSDGFIFCFDYKSYNLSFSTYIGGDDYDYIYSTKSDLYGNIYFTGYTYSLDFPVTNKGNQTKLKENADGFITCIDKNGENIVYSTFFGGSGFEEPRNLYIDFENNIQITGGLIKFHDGDIYLTDGCFDRTYDGDSESFFIRYNHNLSKILYSTYLGGNGKETGYGVLFDPYSNNVILTGTTDSSNFPILNNSINLSFNGGENDIYLIKFNLTTPPKRPINLTALNGDNFVNLKWDPSVDDGGSPIDGYQIHRGTRSSELSFVVGETRELIFNDTTVINGQTYYYAVRAHNYIDYGPMSNIVKVIPFSKPSPPRNLTVDAIGDSYVNLSWSPSEKDGGFPIWSYRLYRSEGSNPIPSLIMDNNKLFYSDTSAKNGIRYTYFVTAESIKGESRPSDPVNATPMGVPGMIQKIIVVTGGGFVKLDWDPPNYTGGSPLLGYEISRSDQSKIIKFTTGPETDEYNDTQVQNGKRYWYQIRSWNTVGYSLYSREYAGEPEDVPGPPRNLTMKMSSRTVELFWDQPSSDGGFPVQFYYIYRSDHTNEWRKISETGPEVTTFKDRSLVNGRTYGYRVTAVSLKGESLPATIMDVVPLGIPTSPNDFSLRAGDGFVDLSWKAPSDTGGDPIDEYMLLRGDVSTTLRELVVLSGSDLSYNDTSVTNGVTYYYAVKAKNIVGEGMATDTLSARPGGLPSPPSDIVIIPYDRSVEITWKPPKNDGGYPVIQVCIYRGTDENTLIKILGIDQATGSYLDTGLENGRTYYYSLCTVNDIGQGIRSDIYSVTPLGKPSSPLSVIVETRSDKARIVWDVPDDDGGSPILSYRIYRSDLQRDPVMIGEVDPDNFYFEDFDVNEGRSYFYSVSATNSQGEGPASEGVLVEIPEGSGPPIILIIILLFVSILLGGGAYLYIRSKRRGLGQDRYRQME